MSTASVGALAREGVAELEHAPERGLAVGFLAMLPLFAAYELGALSIDGQPRNSAEYTLLMPLEPLSRAFGFELANLRWIALAVCAALAVWAARPAQLALFPRVGRIALEGLCAAVVLGPLLLLLLSLLDIQGPARLAGTSPLDPPALAQVALHMGGAAWEELGFRVGLQSLLCWALWRTLPFYLDNLALARWGAEVGALFVGAVIFAAFHLGLVTSALGPGGEAYDGSIFAWRVLAGMLLGILFRWRGPGVAAWTHALFNLAIVIGAGPDVFL
jgi:hypothetical protein